MTDKRVLVHGVKVKGPSDKRVVVFGLKVNAPLSNPRVRIYGLQFKGPADGNRPAYWKDGSGVLHGAELWVKHNGTLTKIT